jgi:hypothetical protein
MGPQGASAQASVRFPDCSRRELYADRISALSPSSVTLRIGVEHTSNPRDRIRARQSSQRQLQATDIHVALRLATQLRQGIVKLLILLRYVRSDVDRGRRDMCGSEAEAELGTAAIQSNTRVVWAGKAVNCWFPEQDSRSRHRGHPWRHRGGRWTALQQNLVAMR